MGAASVDKTLEVKGLSELTKERVSHGDPTLVYLKSWKSRMPEKSGKCLGLNGRELGNKWENLASILVAYWQEAPMS